MEPFRCPGTYADDRGTEDVVWSFVPSARRGWAGRYEIWTTIRGIPIWGADLDGMEPDGQMPEEAWPIALDSAGELAVCILTGDLPCTVQRQDRVVASSIGFHLDLTHQERPEKHLTLSCRVDGVEYAITDDWFEDGVQRLEESLPEDVRIRSCVTCLFSDYSPGGHGLMGIRCHRNAQEQYLAVRSKADYWNVPVTEEVPETYLCPQYRRRIPGTGYRG